MKKNLILSQILDTIGIRIIVNSIDECYKIMALIFKYSPSMPNKIKDYIAIPKENGYQSIHITTFHEGSPIEIQIRTLEMHRFAEYGRANHLNYKKA